MVDWLTHDPVAVKRWSRFRGHRRAFWSLCLLAALYAVSLVSELVANNVPLCVRHKGRMFFPVFARYSEDDILGNGVAHAPDYKRLAEDPSFSAAAGIVVFPPVPFGPHEVIDPSSIPHERGVRLTVAAEPRVGSVNVRGDLVVTRSVSAGWFFATDDHSVPGRRLDEATGGSPVLSDAVAKRLRNEDSPEMVVTATNRLTGRAVEISAASFARRAGPQDSVRVSLREVGGTGAWTVRFREGGAAANPLPAEWSLLGEQDRKGLSGIAAAVETGTVTDVRMPVGGTPSLVKVLRDEVRWPYPPVTGHPMGIDSAGRDVMVRLLYGLRISLSFGLLLVVSSMALGVAIGVVQGYYGGAVDILGQRLTEIWHAIPLLYVMMLLGAVLGRSFALLLVTYILFNWIGISYYLRAEALRLRRLPFVDAARCMGLPDRKIMLRHILPNALTPVVTFFPFSLVGAIGLLAALDYLGFGLPALTPSWGGMLHEAQQYRWAWWLILYPSLALFFVMMLGVFVGEGVRDAYDPRPKSRLE